MTDEEYVRSKWEAVQAQYTNCGMGSSYWIVLSGDSELSRVYCGALNGDSSAWAAAAAFTRDHEEAMRQTASHIYVLRERADLEWFRMEGPFGDIWGSIRSDFGRRYVQLMMVAGKLEAELEKMREGMKISHCNHCT